MKTPFLLLLLLAAFQSAAAQSVAGDCEACCAMRRWEKKSSAQARQVARSATFVPMIVEYDSPEQLDEMVGEGCIVYFTRDGMALMSVPEDVAYPKDASQKRMPGCGSVVMHPATQRHQHLDIARAQGNIDQIHRGNAAAVPQIHGLDGSGVVVGMCDTGFDPHHSAFEGHVSAVYHFDAFAGKALSATTPQEIAAWVTDNADQTHGSHVAGILTGADGGRYGGIAPGAEFVATTSPLDDVGLLCGVEAIIRHAQTAGKPAVINLSVGSNEGPHDGTDIFTTYLDKCAAEGAVVISAGNDGARPLTLQHTFTEDRPSVSAALDTRISGTDRQYYGTVDIWAGDSSPVGVQMIVYDLSDRQTVYSSPVISQAAGQWYTDSDTDSRFGALFRGAVALYSEINPRNGRYHAVLETNCKCEILAPDSQSARYAVVISVSALPGQHLDMWCTGNNIFNSYGKSSLTPGNAEQSVSSIACGYNTTVLGAHTTRDTFTYPDGKVFDTKETLGTVSNYTSYGITYDGRRLPHFCAPGTVLISALSGAYTRAHPGYKRPADTTTDATGKQHDWYLEYGTSMSAPYAAGVYALWLQADPTLTPAQLRDTATATCGTDITDPANPRWGQGCMDPWKGTLSVLGNLAHSYLNTAPPMFIVESRKILAPEGTDIKITTIDGRTYQPEASLHPGIYVITAANSTQTQTHKITIR